LSVDRWSDGTLWMVDEKKLLHRLYTKLRQSLSAEDAQTEAQTVIKRRVLGPYDGAHSET
jgi:hypothetical protein